MSYYKLNQEQHTELVELLVAELGNPISVSDSQPIVQSDLPTIFEEKNYLGRLGVTVVWDRWVDISPSVRGRIILDAYVKAFGPDVARNVGIAMGLTEEEYGKVMSQKVS